MDKKLVLSYEEIQEIVKKIGKEITEKVKNDSKLPIIVGVMKGALNFMLDLIKNIDCPIYTDYIQISSYNGTSSNGVIRLIKDLSFDCKDRTVIIVEDVIDSGASMRYLVEHIKSHRPKEVLVCTLFDKINARQTPLHTDFVGKVLDENDFLIGYGLDYDELGRNLPYVYSATKEDVDELNAIIEKDKENI